MQAKQDDKSFLFSKLGIYRCKKQNIKQMSSDLFLNT